MTLDEFDSAFAPITTKWKNNYSPEQVERIFKHVRDLNSWHLKLIVDAFLDTARQAPLPRDFRDAARAYKKRLGISEKKHEYKYECEHCRDGGMLSLTDRTDGHRTFARCDCQRGKIETWNIPIWGPDLSRHFAREPLSSRDTGFLSHTHGPVTPDKLKGLVVAYKAKMKIAQQYWRQDG